MVILEKKIGYQRDSVMWIDRQNDRIFRRVVAGVHWPGARPGFAVIVGELDNVDITSGARHLHLINELDGGEIHGRDLLGFIRRLSELRGIYGLESIYGDPGRKSAQEVVSAFNDSLPDKGRNGLHIEQAPLIDDPKCFEFCIQIVRKHLVEGRKTLHLGKDSRLPGILASAGDVIMTAKADDYPAIAALGYAVGALDTWKPMEGRMNQVQNGPYDVFTLDQNKQERMIRP